jgi:hypothetical protein
MRINVKEALMLTDKYDSGVSILYLTDIQIRNNTESVTIPKDTPFDQSQYDYLEKANIQCIDVQYNEKLYAKLVSNYPAIYRPPLGRKTVIEFDRFMDSLESANTTTKRKRSVISLCEYYKKSLGMPYEVIISLGEKINFRRWNDIKINLNRNSPIDYRFDECGIIVFFILNASDPNYSQNFMKFTELVSLICDSKRLGVIFSPDFVPETDIYTVNSKSELLKCYMSTNASLIIVGEDLNDSYKEALSQVKAYDRYAKFMVIKNPEPSVKMEILSQIKNVYGSRLWEER